jgi:apolipoprotein N-acyltransferase
MHSFISFIKRFALPLSAGASLPLAFAPFNFWPLAILSPAIFLFCLEQSLQNKNKHSALKVGFFYWLGFYAVGVSWVYVSIHEYGDTPAPIAALLAFIFAAGLALVTNLQILLYTKFRLHRFFILSFPASWVLIEWFRSWFLTGFPWIYNGYAFIDTPLANYASIGGVYSLSFISALLAAFLFLLSKSLLNNQKNYKKIVLAITCCLLLFAPSLMLKNYSWVTIDENKVLRFHLVQGNIPQHDKWLPQNQRKILDIYNDLIQQTFSQIEDENKKQFQLAPEQDIKHVIVLPEAAMPTLQSELKWFFSDIEKQALATNTAFISGIFYDEMEQGFAAKDIYNSITALGNGSGLYHKQRLVPFGEYVPLESFIRGMIPFFDLPYSSFSKGSFGQAGLQVFDFTIAPFICYEILYPNLVYKHAKESDILLTISNDAWFGNSSGPEQHFQMARMRALELGKYLVRTTNTGTTAIINNQGKVVNQLPKNQRSVLTGNVYVSKGQTPYAIWGNMPILIFCALVFLVCSAFQLTDTKFTKPKL